MCNFQKEFLPGYIRQFMNHAFVVCETAMKVI